MARLKACAASVVALISIVAEAKAEPVIPPVAPTEHVARFAMVLSEPRAPLEACGGPAALAEAVERRLGRDAFTDEATADERVVISVAPQPEAQWQVHIGERDASGRETGQRDVLIDAVDCAKGIETLAVVLSIMIGPPRMLPGPPPGASPASVERGQPPPPRVRPAEPASSVRPEPVQPAQRWSVAPAAGLASGSGILPGISWGLEGGVVIHPPVHRMSLIARGQLWPTRAAGTVPEVHVERASLSLLACHLTARRSSATLSLCTGVDGGWLHVTAPALHGASTRPLVDIPIEGRLGFDLSPAHQHIRFEPWLSAQLAVLLLRGRFTFQDRMDREVTLHRAAPVALTASLGLTVHFAER